MKKGLARAGFFRNHSTFIGVGLLFCIVLLLTGCENFLEGASIKRQIEEEIDYAKAPSYEIRVECDDDTGEIITGRILSQKVTDSFNIEFKIARGAKFIGWKAYSKSTDGTLTELSSEYFTFTSIPTEDNSGIYKTSAKFLKKANAITIKPYVQILPAVKNYSPAQNSDGSYANMPVVITFNMPMEDEATQRNDSIFTYTNISLTYEGESLTNYFDAPEFNSEKTVLTLKPHGRDLRDFIIGENRANIDVKVQLSDRISVTRDGISLPLSQDENSTFMVRYKASIEEIVPAKYDFFATRDEISLEQSATQNKFTQNALGTFTDTEIFQNRTNGTIWIYGRYYDADSGVKTVRLTEKRTNNKDGSAAVAAIKTHDFTSATENAQFADDGNGNTSFCIRYNLESDDGAILLGVTVLDACENPSDEQTFTAIKDSGIDLSNVELYNLEQILGEMYFHYWFTSDGTENGERISYDDYPELIKQLKLNGLNKQIYKDCYVNETDLTITLSYKNNAGTLATHNMIWDSTKNRWNHYIDDVTDVSALEIRLTVTDDFGHTDSKEFSFPDVPELIYLNFLYADTYTDPNTTINVYNAFFSTTVENTNLFYTHSDSSYCYKVDSLVGTLESKYTYRYFFSNNLLAGYLTNDITESDQKSVDTTLPPVVIKEASIVPSEDGEYLNITATIDTSNGNPWNTYSSIIAEHSITLGRIPATYTVPKNSLIINFSVPYISRRYFNPNYLRLIGFTSNGASPNCADNGSIYDYNKYYQGYCYLGWPYQNPEIYDVIKPSLGNWGDSTYKGYSFAAMYNSINDIPKRYDYMIPALVDDAQTGIKKIVINADGAIWTYHEGEFLYIDGLETEYGGLDGNFYFPLIWDVDKELNELLIKYYDGNSNCFEWTGSFISAKIPSFSMQSGSLISEEYSGNTLYKWRLGIAKLSTSSSSWSEYSEITTLPTSANGTNGGKIYTYSSLSLPANSFVKIVASAALEDSVLATNFGNSAPYYYYTGSDKNSGRYDYIIPNGKDKSTVLVASDAPTFVHTLITKHSLSSCETWTVDEWEHNHKHIGNQYMDFTGNSTAQKYRIPVSEMDSGDCYVVIAHFADGSSAMSEVMVR